MGCFLVIIIVSAQHDFAQQTFWLWSFLYALIQDILVSPILELGISICIVIVGDSKLAKKYSVISEYLKKISDDEIKKLYVILFFYYF